MNLDLPNFPTLSQATIEDLQHGLQEQLFTSLELVETYLSRIEQINPILNAVIQINPDAATIAKKLDSERTEESFEGQFNAKSQIHAFAKLRRPLHGIPVLLKDLFCILDLMSTSAGTYALVNTRPSSESTIVKLLRSAGAIILGKANLSEWANFRAPDAPDGWSPLGGQSYGPYCFQQDPAGSSTGSAIAAATGLCGFAMGIETSGSIVEPAGKCSIVGLKPTVGLTSRAGTIPGSAFQDTVGPLTRSVKDSAYVLNAIAGKDPLDNYTMDIPFETIPDYTLFCKENGLKGIRVGVPREIIIQSVKDIQVLRDFDSALKILESQGAIIVEDANFPSFKSGWTQKNRLCSHVTFKETTAKYLDSLAINPDSLHSIDDVIAFIKTHREEEHYPEYGVATFETISARTETGDSDEYKDALKLRLFMGSDGGVLGALEKHDCDVLVLPTESDNPTDIAGYPTINVPMGFCDANTPVVHSSPNLVDKAPNVPHGLLFTSRKWKEDILIQCAYAYEQATQTRKQVKLMMEPTIEIWHTKKAKIKSNKVYPGP